MKQLRFSFWALILLCGFITGCEEATLVGSDLLNGEQLELGFNDETVLTAKSIRSEIQNTRNNITLMVGQLDDPFFGKSEAEIYLAFIRDLTTPDLTGAIIDSMVLVMSYDTAGVYGDTMATHHLKVFRMQESIYELDSISHTQIFLTDSDPIGELVTGVNPLDTVVISDPATGEILKLAPQLRIPLDVAFAEEIAAALPNIDSDTLFNQMFKGLKIISETDGSSVLGLSPLDGSGISKINMYYHTADDTLSFSFRIIAAGNTGVAAYFDNDYSGYPVEDFLDNAIKGDSLLFIQGMAGLDIEIDLADARNMDDVFINHAELEFTIAELPMDNTRFYRYVVTTIVSELDEDGNFELITDVADGTLASNFSVLFGGDIETEEVNGVMVKKVKMNITRHLKEIVEDLTVDSKIFLSVALKKERPHRMAFYGPGHSTYPAKLNITFTRK